MQIDLIADSSVSSAPAGFTAAIQAAAAIYDQLFPGNYTVNIRYGWGTWDNQVDPGLTFANGAEGGPVNGTTVSYATVKSWLTANATLPDQQQAIASLPANTAAFPSSANEFYVSSAQEKAFGVYTGSSTDVDGAIGFGKNTSPSFFLEGALHEIGHALGRTTDFYAGDPTIMDLFRYSSQGQFNWSGYQYSYLSINGGKTDLANYSMVSDFGDFAVDQQTPNDPFDYEVSGTVHTLTNLDIELMQVLGFGSTASPPNVLVSTVSNVSVQAGQSVSASTLITSISNPHNDSITQYMYLDNGGGSGHFTVNGVAQSDGQWISASPSDIVQYVGGSSPGSDQLEIGVYDATTHSYAYSPLFSAVTTGSAGVGPGEGAWQVDGFGNFSGTGISEMLMRDGGSGLLEIYYVGNNGSLAEDASAGSTAISLGQVGLDWQVVGFGNFGGSGHDTDMLMQNVNTGSFEVYDINNNAIASAASMGQVGAGWQVAGFGDFSSNANESDMLLRNASDGTFELYDIVNNSITLATSLGSVGLNWQVAGFGDFSSNPNETDMLLRDGNTGSFEIYDIANNKITAASSMGQVGNDWAVVGFGDFSGKASESDMLLRNSHDGTFELYDIGHNTIQLATALGGVGLDWQVVGLGNFSGNANETDMLMVNNSTGNFELYDIANNTITAATSLGQLGLSGQLDTGTSAPTAPGAGTPLATPSAATTDTLYVFVGTFGQNTVDQFNPLIDKVELSATEFPDFATVQSHMQQVGSDTVITYDPSDTITLVGVPMDSLHAANFQITYGFAV